tara:strand:+ start:177 stop:347 length:171 start_codon:yes stop_codon:yes gene_type:complete
MSIEIEEKSYHSTSWGDNQKQYDDRFASHQSSKETVDKQVENLLEYVFGDEFKEVE